MRLPMILASVSILVLGGPVAWGGETPLRLDHHSDVERLELQLTGRGRSAGTASTELGRSRSLDGGGRNLSVGTGDDPTQPTLPTVSGHATRVDCRQVGVARTRGLKVPTVGEADLSIEFEFDSAHLTDHARGQIARLAQALHSEPLVSGCFELEGHTDSIGDESYNQRLSKRRAEAVLRELTEVDRVATQRVFATGRGELEPIDTNDTELGRSHNRRVRIKNHGEDLSATD